MSEQPAIMASYRWTLDDFLVAYSLHRKLFVEPKMKILGFIDYRIFAVFVGCVCTLRLAVDLRDGVAFSFEQLFFVFLIGAVGFLLALPWLQKMALTRQFQKRPDQGKVIQYRIDSRAVTNIVDGSSGTTEWKAFAKVVRTAKGYFFYPNDQVFIWLPNHAFASQSDVDLLAKLAKQFARSYSERL